MHETVRSTLESPARDPAPAGIGPARRRRTPLLTRSFAVLMLSQASFGYAFSSFFLLPKFLVTQLAASPRDVGLAMAIYGLAALACIPAMGVAVDRFGRRDFLTAGSLLMAATCLGFLAVDDIGALLFALRGLQGAAFAMAFVAGVTLAVDEAPVERLAQAIALIGLAMLSMNAIAPVALELIADRLGWAWGFGAAAGAALVASVLSRGVRDGAPGRTATEPVPGLWDVMRHPAQVRIAVMVALAGTAFGAMITFHQPFALALGRAHVSSFFVAYAAAAIVIRIGFGEVIDRAGWRRVSVASLVLYGCVVTAMARLDLGSLALFGAGLGVAHGLFYPALNAIAVAGRGREERGKVMALFQAAFTVGFTAGNYAFGLMAESAGYEAVFITAGLCPFAALAVLLASPEGRSARGRAAIR
jgi:MFS family permease